MDRTPSNLPQAAFTHSPHHVDPYNHFPPVRGPRQPEPPFPPHLDPGLHALDPHDTFSPQFEAPLGDVQYTPQYGIQQIYAATPTTPIQPQNRRRHSHRVQELPTHSAQSDNEQRVKLGGDYGLLAPRTQLETRQFTSDDFVQRMREQPALSNGNFATGSSQDGSPGPKQGGHFPGMKQITNPPNLEQWRQRLFDVDEPVTLTEEEFQIYFPHVDNVYSHRSTQRYKRQPFVSHYWDCRLKGRPPGTPKSDDPNKRKRKRQARERDLCDVKIKITEYFAGARQALGDRQNENGDEGDEEGLVRSDPTVFGLPPNGPRMGPQPGSSGERYYTIQRVNGNGGNGKGDGVAGPHKHTLEESDRVKKNSIQRAFAREAKEKKRVEKTYHKKATGAALATVKRHSKEESVKLYGSCFCPFVQRVWISLELKGVSYQYIEVDPYKKTPDFLAVNPRGLIPALQHDGWNCYESSVLMEYLEDEFPNRYPLLPIDAKARAHSRLWADHVNRKLIPAFYHLLKAQDTMEQAKEAQNLQSILTDLVGAADKQGPFFLGNTISFVDVQLAPWLLRFRRVLKPYRGWPNPEQGTRWAKWADAVEADESVKRTTSTDELYKDSYERYAENRPGTSQVADAVNAGRGLP